MDHLFIGCPELPAGYYYRLVKTEPMSIFDYRVRIMKRRRFWDLEAASAGFRAEEGVSPSEKVREAVEMAFTSFRNKNDRYTAYARYDNYFGI